MSKRDTRQWPEVNQHILIYLVWDFAHILDLHYAFEWVTAIYNPNDAIIVLDCVCGADYAAQQQQQGTHITLFCSRSTVCSD